MLKYQKYFEELGISSKCPPKKVVSKKRLAFRYIYESIENKNNFIPQYFKQSPPRRNSSDESLCSDFALSFFMSEVNAIEYFLSFPQHIKKLLGYKNIAKGQLDKEDGLMTAVNKNGHFDLHEYENVDFSGRFIIISALQ